MNTPLALAPIFGCLWACGIAAAGSAERGASAHVRPIDLTALQRHAASLPPDERRIVTDYFDAARRYVLTPDDGCTGDRQNNMHIRNFAERAKGAAVLSVFDGFWPAELREQCRREAAAWVGEIAQAHRRQANFGNEWQAAFWAAEGGIAGWFLWDRLDADTRDAVAEMVIRQADRFIDSTPKMGYRANTEAETVAWNSAILTLAPNMMPGHPHAADWERAAKTYLYNTFAVARDANDATAGDDGKPVREWIVGVNLYDDFAMENHAQFHIDYVFACYRFHIQGAAMYGVAGRAMPMAFRHHARDVYERVLRPCLDHEGFFAYVPDNDWKRYHNWTESCAVHAYIATLTQDALAAGLERRALANAMRYWRSFPEGFAYDNPYVCGKAWTSRVADAVLLHVTRAQAPPAVLPDAAIDARLVGTHRLETPDLLSHTSAGGSLRTWCRGKGDTWVRFVSPRADGWMLLPVAGNYEGRIDGKPFVARGTTQWRKETDWFWAVRQDERTQAAQAFVSLPSELVIWLEHAPAAAIGGAARVENTIAVEKPHAPFTIYFEGGRAAWEPGQPRWEPANAATITHARWLNLHDRVALIACVPDDQPRPVFTLPKPGIRDAVRIHTPIAPGRDHTLCIVVSPGRSHQETPNAKAILRSTASGMLIVSCDGRTVVAVNFAAEAMPVAFIPGQTPESVRLPPRSAAAWQDGKRLF